ncbi:MAG: hypothetical protein ABL958_20575, partial [Bdellovibrionia bacterium]
MATARQQNIFDMFEETLVFNTENSADYAAIPDAAANFAKVQAAINALVELFATQTSGEEAAATELKSVQRQAVRRKMVSYAKNARAIALNKPGFDELFKVPDENNDNLLVAKGREFVKEAQANDTDFSALGKQPADAVALTTDLDDFEAADAAQAEGKQDTVGATAGIDDEIDEGMKAEKFLDAIMTNVYRDNPIKLAQWKT